MIRRGKGSGAVALAAWLLAAPIGAQVAGGSAGEGREPATVNGDTLGLTIADALTRAASMSEEVRLARSQVDQASAQVRTVRANALPQLSGALGYTRVFESQFNTGGGFEIPDSLRFEPDSTASLGDRVRYLERNAANAGLGALGGLFGNLPFGRENTFQWSLNGSQAIYSGGRLRPALQAARLYTEAADLQVQEALSDIEFSVRTAYHRALFATELARISEAAVAQADQFLAEERLRERTGHASELDVMRAQVASANLRTQLVQATNGADVAMLDLRRLVNIPARQPIVLTTPLAVPEPARLAAQPEFDEAALLARPALIAAERDLEARRLTVDIARKAFMPTASVIMNYGRFLYPLQPFQWAGNEWRPDWSAQLIVDVPIFDGFRRKAETEQAEIAHTQADLRLAQLRENIELQYRQANGERVRAAAEITARQQTVDQAQRVYDLTVLRYDRGLATQLEVSDARLALLQAGTNLAQALTDFYIAEATVQRALGRTGAP